MKSLEQIVALAKEKGASDIHIAAGVPVKLRIDGQLENMDDEIVTGQDCDDYARLLDPKGFDGISRIGESDGAVQIDGSRIRINLYRTDGAMSLALRLLADRIPQLKELGLPPAVDSFASMKKGLILVTGETGSGKSTTLAAILNQINHTRKEHIITLEDPIEYVYAPDQCLISQREIGRDTQSWTDGLKSILREDPDIILIGEMRDAAAMEIALTAAETGHLVFSTVHTNGAVDTVDRVVSAFPAERQEEIRVQLASVLKAVLSQQLLVRKSGHGRVAACELMMVNAAIRNQIRDGNTPQMQSSLLASRSIGSLSMDNCLLDLVRKGMISAETAAENAVNQEYVRKSAGMSMSFVKQTQMGGLR
ncbi:PilT/PilU family type 4a pilus ATPase [Stecheria sp. CLA-KB-P133]|uniref:PilT/PilU family type 4a pilus ATPase n=1 Tax=Grylomicrobium aquisgranensis TaxID=2926318 RepID=A0AB35U518_9FIRM|nr:PilT/PilU family type 4a pilus ATPase [Stecheria sp. CLA-KB-P133]